MVILKSIVILSLISVLFPWCFGRVFSNKNLSNISPMILVVGWIIEWGLFEICAIPLIFMKKSLGTLSILYFGILCIGVIICLGVMLYKKSSSKKCKKMKISYKKNLFWKEIAFFLVLFQILITIFFTHLDADDAFYLGISTTSTYTDTMYQFDPYTGEKLSAFPINYVFSPLPIFWAVLSRLSTVHPLVIAHSIIPAVYIFFSYVIGFYIIKKIAYQKKESPYIGVIVLSIINIFGNTSIYTTSSFLLFRIWQGKAILCNIVLPFIIYAFLVIQEKKSIIKMYVVLFFCELAACMLSSMGVVLTPILLMLCAIYCAVKCRNYKHLFYGGICCLPAIIVGICYVIIKF